MAGNKRYAVVLCGACGKELKTTNHNSDIHLCSACWQKSKRGEPKRQLVKLKDAIQRAKETIAPKPRGTHHETKHHVTGKQAPTTREAARLRAIYGDEHIQ